MATWKKIGSDKYESLEIDPETGKPRFGLEKDETGWFSKSDTAFVWQGPYDTRVEAEASVPSTSKKQ